MKEGTIVADQTAGGAPRVQRGFSRQLGIYYSNCALVATSPRDISIYFGRYVPATDDAGTQTMGELYERQIYMSVEQAENLAQALNATLDAYRAARATQAAAAPAQRKPPQR
jgi:hypothetical protein